MKLLKLIETDHVKSGYVIYALSENKVECSYVINKKLAFGKTIKIGDNHSFNIQVPTSRELIEGFKKSYMNVDFEVVTANKDMATISVKSLFANGVIIASKKEIYPSIESFELQIDMIFDFIVKGKKESVV